VDGAAEHGVTEYRLAPAIVLRVAGAALVALVGLVAVAGGAAYAARATYVVRLDPLGYDVRLVRGAGVKRARWVDVAEVSTAEVHGAPCIVVALRDGRTTTVPVTLLAGDRDEFANRLRALLQQARRA
jgi:hypothetical protein